MNRLTLLIAFCTILTCTQAQQKNEIILGAERTQLYMPLLLGKRVAVLTNQTGRIKNENIVDFFINLALIFVKSSNNLYFLRLKSWIL